MFKALLRSQSDVRDRLFELVRQSPRPVLVAQEHDLAFGGPFERRLPYRHLLEHGAPLSMVVVADDGHEGLWRDPVGELAEAYFRDKQERAAAVSGYILFLTNGRVTYLKRDLWDPTQDLRTIVRKLGLEIPVPEKPRPAEEKPRFRRAGDPAPRHARTEPEFKLGEDDEPTDPEREARRNAPPEPPAPEPPPPDPFVVLGLPRSAGEDEVKKAFRALVVQYHPDKVAHLAPEFRVLAEQKTRELTAAYERAQRLLRGEKLDG